MPVISKFIELKITNQGKYYESLGYGHLKQGTLVSVPVSDLPKNSNKLVTCSCDICDSVFERKYQTVCDDRAKGKTYCYKCSRIEAGNTNIITQSGKPREFQRGENHPRWRVDKSEFAKYCREVTRYTNSWKHVWKSWEHFERIGICGKPGAYQLDHIVSKKRGYDENIPAEIIGHYQNLQIIPWQSNRSKGCK